jgi:hypothetical protein
MQTERRQLNLTRLSQTILGLLSGPLIIWGGYSFLKWIYEGSLPKPASVPHSLHESKADADRITATDKLGRAPDFTRHDADETQSEAQEIWKSNVKHHAPDLIGGCMAAQNNCAGLQFGGGLFGVFTTALRFDPLFFSVPTPGYRGERTGEVISLPGDVLSLDGVAPPNWDIILRTAGDRPPHTVVLKPSVETVASDRTKYLAHSEVRLLAMAWRNMIQLGAVWQPRHSKAH